MKIHGTFVFNYNLKKDTTLTHNFDNNDIRSDRTENKEFNSGSNVKISIFLDAYKSDYSSFARMYQFSEGRKYWKYMTNEESKAIEKLVRQRIAEKFGNTIPDSFKLKQEIYL